MTHVGHEIVEFVCGRILRQCRCATPGKRRVTVSPCTCPRQSNDMEHQGQPVPTGHEKIVALAKEMQATKADLEGLKATFVGFEAQLSKTMDDVRAALKTAASQLALTERGTEIVRPAEIHTAAVHMHLHEGAPAGTATISGGRAVIEWGEERTTKGSTVADDDPRKLAVRG